MDDTLFSSENLLKVLVAVRGSALPKEEKVRLRDLILSYSQTESGPEKEALQATLAAALDEHGKLIDPSSSVLKAAAPQAQEQVTVAESGGHVPSLGRTRVTPTFAAPATPMPKRTEPAPEPVAAPRAPVTVAPPAAPKPVPEPKPVEPSKAAVPVEPAPSPAGGVDPKMRIAEIKRAVNERVGNPVNLIERDQTIGREYMTALLEAIKYSTGGAATGGAIARLETAYKAVTEMLDETPIHAAESVSPPNMPQPASRPAPKPDVPAPQAEERMVMPRPEMDVRREQPAPTPPPRPQLPVKEPTPAPTPVAPPPPVGPRTGAQLRSLAETSRLPQKDGPRPRAAAPAPSAAYAPTAPLPTPPEAAPAPAMSASSSAAPVSPEVEAGLHQLLSEWKLFRRSGFLGTGPSGADHPLYKQLATLPMAAVIAGRFEGATPEVKQSITDYMNGWRYEHSIVHKMEEQFEQYLRRVVAHILKTQKEGTSKK